MFSLILGLFIGAVSVVFALQNIFTVTVTFLAWEITASLALIIAISLLLGLVVAMLFTLPESIKNSFAISRLQKENKKLQEDLNQIALKKEEPIKIVEEPTVTSETL